MTDWKARAEREAAAIIAYASPYSWNTSSTRYAELVTLVAMGWIQGANYRDHESLSLIEDAFDELRAAL